MTGPSTQAGAPAVLLLLPGARMSPHHMVDAGLFETVRQRGLALDLVATDLHADGADNQEALHSLETEWLAPARQKYQHVWLGGISRGGLLALSYLAERVGAVDGLCLLAPYAGSRLTTNAIRRSGGLDAWEPTTAQLQDPEFRLWQWLKHPDVSIPMFMGYGKQDRFADGMQPMAQRLPLASHRTVEGGHDWPTWLTLWADFLDLGWFPARS